MRRRRYPSLRRHLNRNKTAVPYSIQETGYVQVQLAVQWNDSYQESMFCYTNKIPQRDGGGPFSRVFAVRQPAR